MYDVFTEALEMLQKRDDRENDEVRLARFAQLGSVEAGKYLEGLDESKGPDLVLIQGEKKIYFEWELISDVVERDDIREVEDVDDSITLMYQLHSWTSRRLKKMTCDEI
jgi:hypothetical protein